MARRLSLRRLADNWKLKLAALALAVLLWAAVSAEQVTSQWLQIPVEVELRDPGYVLAGGPSPAMVSVRFSGPGRELWELALERPTLTLPVREAGVGAGRRYVLDPQMVRVPPGLTVAAADVRPAAVTLEFRRVATREVPVRVRVSAGSLDRWVVDTLSATPGRVRVTGAADRVAALEAVLTLPLELDDDSAVDRRVQLDPASLRGVRAAVASVRVTGRAHPRTERVFASLPIATPAGFVAAPATARVQVEGRWSVVAGLDTAAVRVVAERPRGAGEDGALLRVEGVPAGAAARVAPARVRLVPLAAVAETGAAETTETPRRAP